MAGADYIIRSHISVTEQIITELYRPASKTFIDRLKSDSSQVVRIDEATILPNSQLDRVLLKDSQIKQKTSLFVCALKENITGNWRINPDGNYQLKAGDTLIFVGDLKNSQKLRRLAENV